MGFEGLPKFVVKHLQNIAQSEGFVERYDVEQKSGSNVGDGYSATLLSIKVIGYRRKAANTEPELDELALVCKLQSDNVIRKELFKPDRLFRQEIIMYNDILPALAGFQSKHENPINGFTDCILKCYLGY